MPRQTTVLSNSGGLTNMVTTEDGDGTAHLHSQQDVQPVIDYCKEHQERVKPHENFRHVAELPMVLVQKLIAEGIWGDSKALLKWLDKPENKPFRTYAGRLV
jgi:hypothetical protein